eukprot:4242461-Pyramimonas_sp.AAC.1
MCDVAAPRRAPPSDDDFVRLRELEIFTEEGLSQITPLFTTPTRMGMRMRMQRGRRGGGRGG